MAGGERVLLRPTARGAGLVVRSLAVSAGGRSVIRDVSFTAVCGEIVLVIGPNGAGKSTMLEAIAGLRRARATEISVGGRDLRTFAERGASFAFLCDGAAPAAELRARRVLELARSSRARPVHVIDAIETLLRVRPLLDRGMGLLSSGERKRVDLGAALMLERPVVLLDEPFGAFDPVQLEGVLQAVRLVADHGVVVIASVHQLAAAELLGDRFLLLADGRAIAFGTLSELRAAAGSMNAPLDEVFAALLRREVGRASA
jgi:ABC-type multidrug transport system ATPase subunit